MKLFVETSLNLRRGLTLLLIAFFGIIFLFTSSAKASAQTTGQALDVTVSPPVFDLTALPGDKLKKTFRIRNNGTSPLNLEVTARRLVSDPANGSPIPETSPSGEELSWVTFSPASFTAPPREWTDVDFTINIPSTAAYGYYYVFSISQKGSQVQKTTGAAVKGELLVVTLLNIKKDGAISKAKIVNFAPKNFITEYLPVSFDTLVENLGNVHVKPHGNIFITRFGKKEIATLDVNAGFGSVLPGGKRDFVSEWTDGFIVREPIVEDGQPKLDSNGKPETRLTINWNNLTHFRVGPYTARLLLVYDDGTRDSTLEATSTFWVVPYTALAVMIISLIVIIVIIKFILGSYIRSQVKKASRK